MSKFYESNWDKIETLQDNYREWKLDSMDTSSYFLIFTGFLNNEILKKISGNALKLYIYLGINSNNFSGTVWHSNKKIAEYFGKNERTIRTWMKELEDNKLILRIRESYNGKVFTMLLPYNANVESKYFEKIEGTLINKNNKLYIKSINGIYPISSGIYIELFDDLTFEWIYGRIYSVKEFENNMFKSLDANNMIYVFKARNEFYERVLDKEFRVRAII